MDRDRATVSMGNSDRFGPPRSWPAPRHMENIYRKWVRFHTPFTRIALGPGYL